VLALFCLRIHSLSRNFLIEFFLKRSTSCLLKIVFRSANTSTNIERQNCKQQRLARSLHGMSCKDMMFQTCRITNSFSAASCRARIILSARSLAFFDFQLKLRAVQASVSYLWRRRRKFSLMTTET